MFKPLTIEQLRYTEMSEGWAAAFEKWGKDFWDGCDQAIMDAVHL